MARILGGGRFSWGSLLVAASVVQLAGCIEPFRCQDTATCKPSGDAGGDSLDGAASAEGTSAASEGPVGPSSDCEGSAVSASCRPSSSSGLDAAYEEGDSTRSADDSLVELETASQGTESDAAAKQCEPTEVQPCWESPSGEPLMGEATGTGECRLGQRTCDAEGEWGDCVGAIEPSSKDSCTVAGADNDCDGVANGGCTCVDGDSRICGEDTGNCEQGMQLCTVDGWGPCEGEVVAEAQDSCAIEGDDADCSGTPNENCECLADESEACLDCGVRQCDPETRTWGECAAPTPLPVACMPDSLTLRQSCGPSGTWQVDSCEFLCADGECAGVCSPDDARCLHEPERRQICVAGQWDTVETCLSGTECVDQGNECRALDGRDCGSDDDCASGFCVDGTCCESRCSAVNCSTFDTQCVTHPASADEALCGSDGACRAAAEVCSEVATALPATTSCDFPDFEGGRCDGNGECRAPSVICGDDVCYLDSEICCIKNGAPSTTQCVASEADCANQDEDQFRERAVKCDENADCPLGQECCYINSSGGGLRVECRDAETCPHANPGGSGSNLCESPVGIWGCSGALVCRPWSDTDFAYCAEQ